VTGLAAPSPEQWLRVRRFQTAHWLELCELAAELGGERFPVAGTALLGRPEWVADPPVELTALPLRWHEHAPAPAADGTGPLSRHVRPRDAQTGREYPAYAGAIAALDRPALFDDRVCYRLLAARLTGQPGLDFGRCSYFDGVNVGHAVAHELAARELAAAGPGQPGEPGLPLRAALGDPCDLARRCAIVAVAALTLRRDGPGRASFFLHWRDPARVNHAGGLYQVMPAGIFQPVTGTPGALRSDLSLWRCLAREYSEEFLGTSEEYPTRDGVLDYHGWPFHQRLAAARDSGALRVWCLGVGVDPLTLATDILTVAVFDHEVFGDLFSGMVASNDEGRLVMADGSAAIPFSERAIERFGGGGEPVQPAGAALLRLAWRHRRHLLG
jgi:hypothetical protein